MLQHIVQVHDVETGKSGGGPGVEKIFHNVKAKLAGMLGGLTRGLQALHVPAALFRGFQEKPGTASDVEETPPITRQEALEAFEPIAARERGPILVFAGMGKEHRLFFGVIGVAVGVLQLGGIGKRNHVAEAADRAGDHIEAFGAGDKRAVMVSAVRVRPRDDSIGSNRAHDRLSVNAVLAKGL